MSTYSRPLSCLSWRLTADVQLHRETDFTADTIGYIALVRPLVIAGHADDSESGASVAELHSSTRCDHRAALQPNIRQGSPVGHRAHENSCVIELHQVGCFCPQSHIRNRHYKEGNNKPFIKFWVNVWLQWTSSDVISLNIIQRLIWLVSLEVKPQKQGIKQKKCRKYYYK